MKTIDIPHEVKSAGWNEPAYKDLLDTYASSSHELLWVVDKDKKIILANEAYKKFVFELTGKELKMDDYALPQTSDIATTNKWDTFYTRALLGEKFNIITSYLSVRTPVMIDTAFIPIVHSDEIMGTACIARNSVRQEEPQSIPEDLILDGYHY